MNIDPDVARYLLLLLIATIACAIAGIVLHRLLDLADWLGRRLGGRSGK